MSQSPSSASPLSGGALRKPSPASLDARLKAAVELTSARAAVVTGGLVLVAARDARLARRRHPARPPPDPVFRTNPGRAAPRFHRLEHRIRAHVLLSWLALLLIRVAERQTAHTWRRIALELQLCT